MLDSSVAHPSNRRDDCSATSGPRSELSAASYPLRSSLAPHGWHVTSASWSRLVCSQKFDHTT